jgi:predicted RNA-binding Zn-ribbon protein involved in translation (DUF1610 family)
MFENDLTQRFCVPCMTPLELRGEPEARRWECPTCGASAARRIA